MDGNQRETFLINFQAFLENRLTTPTYALASRAYSTIASPFSLSNTQGLLDGLSLTLQDNPNWIKSAWGLIQSHLKRSYQRLEDVNELLKTTPFLQARHDKAGKLQPEGRYRALAAVQDVYLAFCVVDATLKTIPLLTPIKFQREVREMMESALPSLVCDCFPPLAPISTVCEGFSVGSADASLNTFLQEAMEAYRWQFWDLLGTWRGSSGAYSIQPLCVPTSSGLSSSSFAEGTVSSDANQRIVDYIDHTMKVRQEAAKKAAALSSSSSSSAHGLTSANYEGLRKGGFSNEVMGSLFPSSFLRNSSEGRNSSGNFSSTNTSGTITLEMMDKRIRSFLNHIFPSRLRGYAHRHRCAYCGAPFDSDTGKNAHYRCHFHSRNALRPEEKVVRLLFPTPLEFIEHIGDSDRTGYFPKVTLTLEEAYKGGAKGAVSIRRQATKSSGTLY